MKRLFCLLLLLSCVLPVSAQVKVYVQNRASTDFTGTCTTGLVGISNDTYHLYVCEAAAWVDKGGIGSAITGSGAASNLVAIWSGTTALKGDADLTWDGTNTLGVVNLYSGSGSITGDTVRGLSHLRPPTAASEGAACTNEGELAYKELNAPSETELFVCAEGTYHRVLRDGGGGSATTAKGLKAADSAGVPSDLDGDGTNDATWSKNLGPRGIDTDANDDGTLDNPLWPKIKAAGQPLGISPSGITTTHGLIDRGIEPVIVFGFDDHFTDTGQMQAAQTACDLYNIPCGDQPQIRTGATYPTSALAQAWTATQNTIGNHGSYHAFAGYDSVDGSRFWKAAGYRGFYNTGTAICTNGSTTVSGTSTLWNNSILASNIQIGMRFICDWDNDGTMEQADRIHARVVTDIDGTAQTITLDDEYDGTTNDVARPYELRASYIAGITELDTATAIWKSVLGTEWQNDAIAQPGSWGTGVDIHSAIEAARDIPFGTSYDAKGYLYGNNMHGTNWGQIVDPMKFPMSMTNCNWTTADATALLDLIVKERLAVVLNVEGIQADGDCTNNGGYMKATTWDGMLSYANTLRAAGKLRVLSMDDMGRYVRSIPQPQQGWNAISNHSFVMLTNGAAAQAGASHSWFPGWRGLDGDHDKAGVQHWAGAHNTWTGDGAGTLTVENDGTAESGVLTQCVQVWPGWTYLLTSELDCTDITQDGTGKEYIQFTAYDYDGTAYSTAAGSQDIIEALDPIWWGSATYNTTFYRRTVAQSIACGNASSARVWVSAQFHVPDLWNEPVCVQMVVDTMKGTGRFKNLALIPLAPVSDQTAYGNGMGLRNVQLSRAGNNTGGMNDEAFTFLWAPVRRQSDTDGDGSVDTSLRADAPTVDLFGMRYLANDNSKQRVMWGDITAKGLMDLYVTGKVYADPDGNGTTENLRPHYCETTSIDNTVDGTVQYGSWNGDANTKYWPPPPIATTFESMSCTGNAALVGGQVDLTMYKWTGSLVASNMTVRFTSADTANFRKTTTTCSSNCTFAATDTVLVRATSSGGVNPSTVDWLCTICVY